jgi:hypothetical protein
MKKRKCVASLSAGLLAYYLVHGVVPPHVRHLDGDRTNNAIANIVAEEWPEQLPDDEEDAMRLADKRLSYDPVTGIAEVITVGTLQERGGYVQFCFSAGARALTVPIHRFAYWKVHGHLPAMIDHANGDSADNRIDNLRAATPSQNNMNSRIRSDNTSGHRGVRWHKRKQKWEVSIRRDTKRYYVGDYKNLDEAVAARREAEAKYHGQFARTV